MTNDLEKFLKFISVAEKLKKIERFKGQFYWRDYPKLTRYESVADHSWRLALLILLFKNKLPNKFDVEKALTMAIIHDLPEIFAGDASPMGKEGTGKDTHAFNKTEKKKRSVSEKKAAKTIFNLLPDKEYNRLYKLWLDYEKQESIESKIVKGLDRLECMLQVFQYRGGYLFKKHKDFTVKYGQEHSKVNASVNKFGKLIASKIENKYIEFKKD